MHLHSECNYFIFVLQPLPLMQSPNLFSRPIFAIVGLEGYRSRPHSNDRLSKASEISNCFCLLYRQ